MYQQNHKQLKYLLSLLLSIAISLICIIPNTSIRSFADSINVNGPDDGTIIYVLSGTAIGSAQSPEGAVFSVVFQSENNLSTGSTIEFISDKFYTGKDQTTNPKVWTFWAYTTAQVVNGDEFTYVYQAKDSVTNETATRHITVRVVDPLTITFDPNGGNVATSTATTNEYKKLASLPNATMEGQVFDGWYSDAEGGFRITTDTEFEGDVTVYAHWRASANPYPSAAPSPEKPAEDNSDSDGFFNSPPHRDNMGTPEDTPPAEDPNSYENFQVETNKTLDNTFKQLNDLYNAQNVPGLINLLNKGLTIDAGNWQSFKEETYKKLDALSEMGFPVTIKYTYNKMAQSVTIPANLRISLTSLCKNGYCGFEYLRGQMNMYEALGFLPTASTAAVSSSAGLDSIAPAEGIVITAAQVSAMIESAQAVNPTASVLDVNFGNASSLTADSLIALCEKNQVAKRIHFTHNGMKFVLFVPAVDPTSASYQMCKALLDAEPGKQANPIRLSQIFASVGFSISGE